ncbi:tryptophan aminotransferase-related protein 2 isoform X2 [Diospyros lotus]|uniref:tryptophan aminotransferase-related protein 2 isoform X2 n=1 Tax=Diospyros lotus TaxID=55363 RepID=UPI002256F5C2|nr:tryptophan aminotransferase-related protein 2 isoform X2 [Diospyros lotus]
MDKMRALSLKHLLALSLALNVGLILRIGHVGETWRVALGPRVFCWEEKQRSSEAAYMADPSPSSSSSSPSPEQAHASKRTLVGEVASASAALTEEVEDDGGRVVNLDHGDPTLYERFWRQMGDKTTVVMSGWQSISYFSDITNVCWFLEPEFAKAVVRLHKLVGNAITENRYIVVGTGSTQLFHAALYALCPPNASEPTSVLSAVPYYSSGLYKWGGDAHAFDENKPYIELVTSPNNPDGSTRQAVINRDGGILVHDLAYYWPQYTPILSAANHDLMMFTVSKSTGHAGTRIGWALVKDEEVARKMTLFIELNTLGVSKDSQLRAAKIMQVVADSCGNAYSPGEAQTFFGYGYHHMAKRWKQLRAAVEKSRLFSLPNFPTAFCNFSGRSFESQPAFAWLKCEGGVEDCASFLGSHGILTRGGEHFGFCSKYVRVSMLLRDEDFDIFTKRLSSIQS